MKRCSRCKSTIYCSKICQKSHFMQHDSWCMTIESLKRVEMAKRYQEKTVRQCQIDAKTQSKMVRLVGRRPMIKCHLDGTEFDMLWDTGSMICLVDRKWVDKHFPGKAIDTVSEFLEREGVKDLKLKAANTTEIKLDGVVVVQFSLKEGEEGIAVPMLVASEEISQPILGYNVIEELILSGSLEHRVALQLALKTETGPVKIDALAAVIEERAQHPDWITDIKMANTVTVPAGRKMRVRCRVKAVGNDEEQTVYFQPKLVDSDDEVTVTETVCTLRRGRTNYVHFDVLNETRKDRVLGRGTVMGSVHSVSAVIPMVRSVGRNQMKGDVRESPANETGETPANGTGEALANVNVVEGMTEEELPGSECNVLEGEVPGVPKWNLSHLTEEQRAKLEKMLQGRQAVFSKDDCDIGDIKDFQMPINLVDQEPVAAAYRKIPPHLYQEVKNYIADLETNGWIQESFSSHSSPIVYVRKPNGLLRMCID